MIRLPRTVRRALIALPLVATVAGCAAQTSTRYPSLLPRAVETRSDAEPEVPLAIADPDPTLDAALGESRKSLEKAVTDFTAAAATAERLATAAKGDKVGSERWIDAQTALAGLDGLRATTSSLVTDLDALALARAADAKPPYPSLETLRGTAQAALDAQTARIAAIAASLPTA